MNPTESRRRRGLILWWFLTALYAACIFVISSIPGDDLPQIGIGDKLVHALVFGGLAILTCRALRLQCPAWSVRAVGGLAVLATLAYGCVDEMHQGFVSGRQPELADALADGVGAALAGWGWKKATLWNWQRYLATCRGPDSNRHGRMVQRILSPLCLPFHHPGGKGDARRRS